MPILRPSLGRGAHLLPLGSALLALVLLVLLAPRAPAQIVGGRWHTGYTFNGSSAGDHLGFSVGGGGDVDGDGIVDLVVGAYAAEVGVLAEAGTAAVFSGDDGTVLYTLAGEVGGDHFGWSVAYAGDLNGDGYGEAVIGAPLTNANWQTDSGSAFVMNGFDGSLLYRLDGEAAGDSFGYSVARAGDVDGDGFDDVAVGANLAQPGGVLGAGSAYVFSGADGSRIHRFDGTSVNGYFGWNVGGAGDVDADGFDDVIVAAPFDGITGASYVYSGATGALLWTFPGLGRAVDGAGDVNQDGNDDVICGASTAGLGGRAIVYSGLDGSVLLSFSGAGSGDDFGDAVAGAGDVDADDYPDVIIGAPNASPSGNGSGTATVYSGRDGALLREFQGDSAGDHLGRSVSSAGDVDDNGHADLIVGADGNQSGAGSAYVYLLNPYITLDSTELSASSGTNVEMELDFPLSEAGYSYVVLVSAAGVGPTTLGGIEVPLTPDFVFNQILAGKPPAQLLDAYGTLDFLGNGDATFLSDPALAAYVGMTVYTAAVSYDSATSIARRSSVAKPITIVP